MLPYQTLSRKDYGISIVGIGGAGAGILQCFAGSSADNVRLYTASLDERMRFTCGENVQFVQLGGGLSHGLGSGGDPEVGRRAAEESQADFAEMLKETHLLVLVAGLGGGTGSGAAPVLARMAQERGIFLVTVLLMPFSFEGKRRRDQAEKAQEEIARLSDILFCFENDYMENLFSNNHGARAVFEEVDRILAKATAAVPMLASSPGLINLGLDELATALENNDSRCIFGSGKGFGTRRAELAARNALASPLVAYRGALRHARTVIVHVAGGENMALHEIRVAVETVKSALADEDVNIFFGTTVKPHLGDEIRVTLIASVNDSEFKAAMASQEEEEAPATEPTPVETATAEPTPEEAEEAPLPEPDEQEEVHYSIDFNSEEFAEETTEVTEEEEEKEEAPADQPEPEPKLRQGELMPMREPTPPPVVKPSNDEHMERARRLFAEIDGDPGYYLTQQAQPKREEAPPSDHDSLRHHDLRNIFPN